MLLSARRPKVLICDDDQTVHLAVKHSLKRSFDCVSAYNGDEAFAIMSKNSVDLVLMDVQMRTPDEGFKTIPRLTGLDADVPIVMLSGHTDFSTVREAMRLGATDYVPKDFDPNELEHAMNRVLERRLLLKQREQQDFEARTQQTKTALIGESPSIVELKRVVEKIRNSPANVVITGETGTGKEVVARLLRSQAPDGTLAPFVAMDSSTIQSTMAESMLFGHEKGAFTGALETRKGVFEEADGGTVYFDEVANMPLDIQAKLLRVLQEKEVTRLGSARVMQLEFRVIAATNRDLGEMVRRGEFRDDLLQRLNVIPLKLEPLRNRKSDIPALVSHFVAVHSPGQDVRFTEEALDTLQSYGWPGNIRELRNVIAYVLALAAGPEIEVADLPPHLRDGERPLAGTVVPGASAETPDGGGLSFYAQVERFESGLLRQAYSDAGANISRMALNLGMDRSHLYKKLRQYGIHPKKPD